MTVYTKDQITAACETLERGLGIEATTVVAAGSATPSGINVVPFTGAPPAATATSRRSAMTADAMSVSPTLVAELEAAEPHVNIPRDHDGWRDVWMFPLATAARRDPLHRDDYRKILDRGNRRSADPAKACEPYFAKGRAEFDAAVTAAPDRPKQAEGICANAVNWDGLTTVQRAYASARSATAAGSPPAPTTVVVGSGGVPGQATGATFFTQVKFDASSLRPVEWLVLGLLLRGEITVLSALGGGAKTALAVIIAVALAAGRTAVGPFKVRNRPEGLRVAFLSAEEDRARFALLVTAAASVLALDAAELARVGSNLGLHDAQNSGWLLGAARPAHREEVCPAEADVALSELAAALHGVDLLIMDNLAALFALPNENSNPQVTSLMRRVKAVAAQAGCAVLLLHHAPKMTREAAAGLRGEASLVRGGGGIVNSARVVITITTPPDAEAGALVMAGLRPDSVRRIEPAKINDAVPWQPAYFAVTSVPVKVHDGSEHGVRAVEFIQPPAASSSFTNADRNVVMKAVDAGIRDAQGAQLPLSSASGPRNALKAVGDALMNARPALTEPQAKQVAREILKELQDRFGCVVEEDQQVAKYRPDGRRNGTRAMRGLATRWQLAPWMSGQLATETAPASDSQMMPQGDPK